MTNVHKKLCFTDLITETMWERETWIWC